MPIALVTSTAASKIASPITSAAIDTTGANLICVVNSGYATGVNITDNKGNTWTTVSPRLPARFCTLDTVYCLNPTVGAGHTFTSTGSNYNWQSVAAFSGAAAASALDQTAAASVTGVTSHAAGSVTPTENNELVVAFLAIDGGTTNPAIGSSFNLLHSAYNTGPEGGGLGYIVQTSAAATNPSWSWSGSCAAAAVIASFKAAAAPAGSVFWPGSLDGLGSGGPFYRSFA